MFSGLLPNYLNNFHYQFTQKIILRYGKLQIVENLLTCKINYQLEYSVQFLLGFSEEYNNKAKVNIKSIDLHQE